MRHLFKNFLDNHKTYVLAENFWSVTIGGLLIDNDISISKWLATKNNNNIRFFDGDPIFSLIDCKQNRALRVIQLAPISNSPKIKVWIEKRLNQDDDEIDVLSISLELSEETKQVVIRLVESWFITKKAVKDFDKLYIDSMINNLFTYQDNQAITEIKK